MGEPAERKVVENSYKHVSEYARIYIRTEATLRTAFFNDFLENLEKIQKMLKLVSFVKLRGKLDLHQKCF